MSETMNDMESQVQEAIRVLAPRCGFAENSLNVEVVLGVMDEFEVRISTFFSNTPIHTTIRFTAHSLRASAMGQAPMIIEQLERGIRSLRSHILGSCSRQPEGMAETLRRVTYDPAPRLFPQIPNRSPSIPSTPSGKIDTITITCGDEVIAHTE